MPAEGWSALFAGATFVVIAATAVAALIQLRHLRASNQLNALLTVMRLWQSPELQEQIGYARGELQKKIHDPAYLAEFATRNSVSRSEHRELLVCDLWEQVGAFMKHGLMDERSLLDVAAPQIYGSWDSLEPVLNSMRAAIGPSVYENFEYAAVRARLWVQKYPDGFYPANTPRMEQVRAMPERGSGK